MTTFQARLCLFLTLIFTAPALANHPDEDHILSFSTEKQTASRIFSYINFLPQCWIVTPPAQILSSIYLAATHSIPLTSMFVNIGLQATLLYQRAAKNHIKDIHIALVAFTNLTIQLSDFYRKNPKSKSSLFGFLALDEFTVFLAPFISQMMSIKWRAQL